MHVQEDKWFNELIERSAETITRFDFEDKVMRAIELESKAVLTISRNRKQSWVLFGIGTLFGMSLPYLIPWNNLSISSSDLIQIRMATNIIITIGILVVFGVLLNGSLKKRNLPSY